MSDKYELPEDLYEIIFDTYPTLVPLIERQMNSHSAGGCAYLSVKQLLLLLTRLRESGLLWKPWFMKQLREAHSDIGRESQLEKYVRGLEEENKQLKERMAEQPECDIRGGTVNYTGS